MPDQSPVLEACRTITQDKITLFTKALAAEGRVTKHKFRVIWGFSPLTHGLVRLTATLKKITPDDFKPDEWRKTIAEADRLWWEWLEKYPLADDLALDAINYTPPPDEQLELREQLRAKYVVKVEAMS